VSEQFLNGTSAQYIGYTAGLPWEWEFPWEWEWDGYGNCDEFPWELWEFCGNF